MQIIPRSSVEIRKRQRSEDDVTVASTAELKHSILSPKGLLQPPFGWYDPSTKTWVLTGGRRRLFCIDQIAKEGKSFLCNGETIPPGSVPFLTLHEAIDTISIFEAEFDENYQRSDPSWQDRMQALADLHEMRQSLLPPSETQTQTATAVELVEKKVASSIPVGRQMVRQALTIAPHLSDPAIAKARNAKEAEALVLKRDEERLNAIITRRLQSLAITKPNVELRHGDSSLLLPTLESDFVDLICTDPPYGIGANAGGFRSRTVHHHNYTDDMDTARNLLQTIITEGFRITKPRANMFIFSDIDLFPFFKQQCLAFGWTPFRTPLIWRKSESEGLAPWGSSGPRRTYDVIFYATKGERGLGASPVDIFDEKRVGRTERTHAAEKPVPLMKYLIECATLPNEFVLDPCCGSGSTIVAAKQSNRAALGIELDLATYNTAMSNVFGGSNA